MSRGLTLKVGDHCERIAGVVDLSYRSAMHDIEITRTCIYTLTRPRHGRTVKGSADRSERQEKAASFLRAMQTPPLVLSLQMVSLFAVLSLFRICTLHSSLLAPV